jgi:hypothetical protein
MTIFSFLLANASQPGYVPPELLFERWIIALTSYYERAGRKDLAARARERAKKLGVEVSEK